MTLEQLRVFITVAENQHVTKAAKELNLTQSAASAAIASLEERYKARLFDRVGRGVVLTHAGRVFLSEAKAVVAKAAAAKQMLHDLAGLKRGSLMVAASQTIANYWLPERLHRFKQAFPDIHLKIEIGNTQQVSEMVESGSADLGFVEGAIQNAVLTVEKIVGDTLIVVVGRDHPWASRDQITPKDFRETSWVLREKGSGTRSMFESALRSFNIDPSDLPIAFEVPSNEAICALVAAGRYATAISNLVVDQSLRSGAIHGIQCNLPGRSFFVLRHRERHLSQAEIAVRSIFEISAAEVFSDKHVSARSTIDQG